MAKILKETQSQNGCYKYQSVSSKNGIITKTASVYPNKNADLPIFSTQEKLNNDGKVIRTFQNRDIKTRKGNDTYQYEIIETYNKSNGLLSKTKIQSYSMENEGVIDRFQITTDLIKNNDPCYSEQICFKDDRENFPPREVKEKEFMSGNALKTIKENFEQLMSATDKNIGNYEDDLKQIITSDGNENIFDNLTLTSDK